MNLAQQITGGCYTKAGAVRVAVTVEVEGEPDGAVAVLRDVTEGVAAMKRLGYAVGVGPVVEREPHCLSANE